MLILTRRLGETIRINDDISVVIHAIRNGQISLGIDAPPNVVVHREEIYQRIQAESPKESRAR